MKPIKTLLAATIILTLPATPALATTIPPANIGIHKTANEPAPPDTGGGNNSGKGSSNQGSESKPGKVEVHNDVYTDTGIVDINKNLQDESKKNIETGKKNTGTVNKNKKNSVGSGAPKLDTSFHGMYGKTINLNNACISSMKIDDKAKNSKIVSSYDRILVNVDLMRYKKTDSGFDSTFVNKCPKKESVATDKLKGKLESVPYMAAYAKKDARKEEAHASFMPTPVKNGYVTCSYSKQESNTGRGGVVTWSPHLYFSKKHAFSFGNPPSCLKGIISVIRGRKTIRTWGHGTKNIEYPRFEWVDNNFRPYSKVMNEIKAAKCEQSGGKFGVKSPLTASGFLPFNEKVKADKVGTDSGGFVADNYSPYTGGIEKGCAYWVKRTSVKLNSIVDAWARCVVSYQYKGETLAGDYWAGYGDEQDKIHNTPYGEAIKKSDTVDLKLCTDTINAKFPEKGNLFPTGKLGRYGARFTWKIDDPEVEIKNCEPDGKGGCKDWSAKIVKHNITDDSPYYMYRQGCDFNSKNKDNSMTWVRRFETLTDEDKKNPEFDKYRGKLLSYNIDDCMDDTGNGVNKYSCTNNTSGKQPTLADDESDKTSVGKKEGKVTLYNDKDAQINSPYIYDRKKPDKGVDGREDVYKNGGMRLYRNNKPQWVKFPKPSIGYDNKKTSAPSNARLTEQYLLIRNGGTPFVSTPEANSVWSYNNDKDMFIPKPGTVKRTDVDNPFINKTTSQDGSRLRVNKYFNDGTVDGYDAAKSLNIKISEPNSGTVQTQIITPMRKKLDGTKYSKFDNDYIIPLKNNRGENAYFDMKYGVSLDWWSEQGKPLQVAPAAKIRAKFPITFLTFNKGVNPNHDVQAWAQNVSDIEKEMMCIGPYTNIAGIRGTQ